ncbi:MAG TPA: amidase [Verrucomicrobiae bacterium]|nr:amidase [Verrucomicrobiae bacterium]
MTELCLQPAYRLVDQLRTGKVSAVELLEAQVARMERRNPALNAVVATDLEGARARALEADAKRARGEPCGALHGLPMTIKDSLEVAGMVTACGAPSLKEHRPARNAAAVQRLLDAGANIFGKTNVPLFAGDVQTFNPVYGTTNNPWNVERTPGGSSGGAAAALAAGMTTLELGSDLAGSIRTPAHFCGVYGHKPSYGIVPTRGHIPGPPGMLSEPDLSVVGPLARSAQDLALMLPIVAGPIAPMSSGWKLELPRPRRASLREYRVQAWLDDPACAVDASMKPTLEAAVEAVRRAGAEVATGAPAGISLAEIYDLYFALLGALFAGGLPEKVYGRARMAGAAASMFGRDHVNTLPGFLARATLSHRDYLKLHEKRERLKQKFEVLFASCDVLLLPVTRTPAPPHNQKGEIYGRRITVNGQAEPYASQFAWIAPATLAGLPATSAPVGRTTDGLPVGIQIVGAFCEDLGTIDFARLLGEVHGGFVAPP